MRDSHLPVLTALGLEGGDVTIAELKALVAVTDYIYESGISDGRRDGFADGYDDGYSDGYDEGAAAGYSEGYSDSVYESESE